MTPAKKKSPIQGQWRITEMEVWDADYLDMEVEAFIEFGSDRMGKFQFGLVRGFMDCRLTERDGKAAVEWSWQGADENDPALGRGWAVLVEDGTLKGRIFIHHADDSAFTAKRM